MDKDYTCLLITTKQLCLQKGGIKDHLLSMQSNATNQPQEQCGAALQGQRKPKDTSRA